MIIYLWLNLLQELLTVEGVPDGSAVKTNASGTCSGGHHDMGLEAQLGRTWGA